MAHALFSNLAVASVQRVYRGYVGMQEPSGKLGLRVCKSERASKVAFQGRGGPIEGYTRANIHIHIYIYIYIYIYGVVLYV